MKNTYGPPSSTGAHQNISRAVMILDALAAAGKNGLRQADLVRATGLQKSVMHRALAGLTAYGLAAQNGEEPLFFLGDKILAWMHQSKDRFALADRIVPHLKSLAGDLLDTVYFSIIRNGDAVCYGREEGSFPIRTLTLEVGAVRPLGVGSGSLAILAFQPQETIERILAERAEERSAYGIDDAMLRQNIKTTREKGYALHKGLFAEGMMGLGVPVLNAAGECVGSLSTAAITERLSLPRLDSVVTRIQAEANRMSAELKEMLDEI